MARAALVVFILLLVWIGLPVLFALSQGPATNYLPMVAKDWSLPTPTSTATPGYVLITEVLYNPIGDEPDHEWVEIYNPGTTTVNLTDYKIGDEETSGESEGMHSFPEGTLLLPNQVLVIAYWAALFEEDYGFEPDFEFRESNPDVPNLAKYTPWASGTINLGNIGDEVLLLSPSDELLDALSWGTSTFAFFPSIPMTLKGNSLERRPGNQDTDSASDWIDQFYPEPGEVNLLPPVLISVTPTPTMTQYPTKTSTPTRAPRPTQVDGGLVISEVLYHPSGSEYESEWIEMYNTGARPINLSAYKVGDEETPGGGEGMFGFPFGTIINSDQVIVIANTASYFIERYGFPPDFEIVESDTQVPNLIVYSDWSTGTISLGNPSEEVLILNEIDQVVDALSWGESTWAFEPACPDVGIDHSLERRPASIDTDSAADWIDQQYPQPGQVYHDQ